MLVSFHNLQQEITNIGNFRNSHRKLSNSREFPAGIFDVAHSWEFPNGNSQWPWRHRLGATISVLTGSTLGHLGTGVSALDVSACPGR